MKRAVRLVRKNIKIGASAQVKILSVDHKAVRDVYPRFIPVALLVLALQDPAALHVRAAGLPPFEGRRTSLSDRLRHPTHGIPAPLDIPGQHTDPRTLAIP